MRYLHERSMQPDGWMELMEKDAHLCTVSPGSMWPFGTCGRVESSDLCVCAPSAFWLPLEERQQQQQQQQ